MTESMVARWRRRAVTIPAMLAATSTALALTPVVVPVAVAADLARLRFRLPALRVWFFVLQYLVNDSIEIVAAPALWARAGLGRTLGRPRSIERHRRLQWWSLRLLARRARTLLGLRVELEPGDGALLTGGGAIVLARHVSLFDASLPALLYQPGVDVRGVMMAELLNDPGFDLIYQRSGSVYIPRDDGRRPGPPSSR